MAGSESSAIISWDVGVKNLSFCIYTRDHQILAWDDLDTSIRRGTSLAMTVKKMTDYLNDFHDQRLLVFKHRITHCVIENQPKRNPTMRVVSGIIGTFFYMKCGWAPVYYNPVHKLASVDFGAFENVTTNQKKKKARWGSREAASAYRMRKQASIEETRRLLQEYSQFRGWLQFFERHRKKDDLGDTLLMSRAFLKAGEPVEADSESSSDSDSDEEADEPKEEAGTGAGAGAIASCALQVLLRNPIGQKTKTKSNSFEYYKFCLEDRLHKEYGKDGTFQDAIQRVLKSSKAQGILDFKRFLGELPVCSCGTCNIFQWMFTEPHWKHMFQS